MIIDRKDFRLAIANLLNAHDTGDQEREALLLQFLVEDFDQAREQLYRYGEMVVDVVNRTNLSVLRPLTTEDQI